MSTQPHVQTNGFGEPETGFASGFICAFKDPRDDFFQVFAQLPPQDRTSDDADKGRMLHLCEAADLLTADLERDWLAEDPLLVFARGDYDELADRYASEFELTTNVTSNGLTIIMKAKDPTDPNGLVFNTDPNEFTYNWDGLNRQPIYTLIHRAIADVRSQVS